MSVTATELTTPSPADRTGVPRGARMSIPWCSRRPPSRSAPKTLAHRPAVLPENRKAQRGERVLRQRIPPAPQELWLQAEQVCPIVGHLELEPARPRWRAGHVFGGVRAGIVSKQIDEELARLAGFQLHFDSESLAAALSSNR